MKRKYITIVLILLCAVSAIAGVYATSHRAKDVAATETLVDDAPAPVYGPSEIAAFREMISVCHHADSLDNFYMKGNMQGKDPVDSTNQLNTEFVFCKRGKTFYYRLGDQEMIALPDMYIDINSSLKKIQVSSAKDVTKPDLMNEDALLKMWEGESYAITRDTSGGQVAIRLLCENHATCKEYRMTYDPLTRLPKSMFMRLTDLNDPFNKERDRVVQVSINEWRLQPVATLLDRLQYVNGSKGAWKGAHRYTDYEVSVY